MTSATASQPMSVRMVEVGLIYDEVQSPEN
jgi:hypothetical protein